MKKAVFILICLIATTLVHAQNSRPVATQQITPCPIPVMYGGDEEIANQQFIRQLNDVEYRIVLEEHPNNPSRNCIQIYQRNTKSPDQTTMVSNSRFSLPAYFDDFSVLPSHDQKKLVVSYKHNGKEKIIEIK